MKNIWINGCFDILHYGHFSLINKAKSLGHLRIGIDSDERLRNSKGKDRPFHNVDQRIYNLLSIEGVNDIVVFDTDKELSNLLKEYQQDIFVIGDDYKNKTIIGKKYAKEIIYFPRVEGFSTTKILENE